MSKRILLVWIITVGVLLAAFAVDDACSFGHLDALALGGYGVVMQSGEKPTTALFGGFDIAGVDEPGYRNFVRTIYFQSNEAGPELQAIQVWSLHEVPIGLFYFPVHLCGGIGFQNKFINGDDELSLALKIEPGIKIKNRFGISLGVDIMPGNNSGDRVYTYMMLNFSR